MSARCVATVSKIAQISSGVQPSTSATIGEHDNAVRTAYRPSGGAWQIPDAGGAGVRVCNHGFTDAYCA